MHPSDLLIKDFTYDLPDNRIAHYPKEERDQSKLLVYENGTITDDIYKNIANYIPPGSLMVFNQTRVVHARLLFTKPTGGAIEIFCLEPATNIDITTAMLQKEQATWICLVGGAKKWKAATTLELICDEGAFTLLATIAAKNTTSFSIQFNWDNPNLTFADILYYVGKVPLPPYLNRDANTDDETSYQTIFAKHDGSVAAPTAGLHFTDQVMDRLAAKSVLTTFVTLHVGAGTFMPVKSDSMLGHEMHAEWIEISRETLHQLISSINNKIVAVGTTSMRTIESLYHAGNKLYQGIMPDFNGIAVKQWDPYEAEHFCSPGDALQALLNYMESEGTNQLTTRTRILIAPGYQFRIACGLVTNFHQPHSTLLLLVAALIGDDWKNVYAHALANDYRFLSYGDGSLLWGK